jgi:rSAM/selenodomain-associated transferase 2
MPHLSIVPRLSIVIPVLNESAGIEGCLSALAPLRARGVEVIVADGGSTDNTRELAAPHCDAVVIGPSGRAFQMNAGFERATGDVLLFLHADSRLPDQADELILQGHQGSGRPWGRFDVVIEGRHALLPVIAWFMNRRSRLTGIATGDQGIFVTRAAFEQAGKYASIRLMEDVALCNKLRRTGPPLCLSQRIVTSGRRWERHGAMRTILLMWRLRLAYFLGADPNRLAETYYGPRA